MDVSHYTRGGREGAEGVDYNGNCPRWAGTVFYAPGVVIELMP